MSDQTLPEFAAFAAGKLRENFGADALAVMSVLNLAEEAGEFTGAYRRWAGLARRAGSREDMEAELADVVLAAYVAAEALEFDLEAAWRAKAEVVTTRGWKEARSSDEMGVARLRSPAETLGRIVTRMSRSMEAARIEMLQNGPAAAREARAAVPDHEHAHSLQPPEGSYLAPGPCRTCGKSYDRTEAERGLAAARARLDAVLAAEATP
jgi:NTP pyrophosphatase (non-canonical NTP hydrolase)